MRNWSLAALILVLTLIAYTPAMQAGYIWDDDDYLTGNQHLHDFEGLKRLWIPGTTKQYYPMVFTTFWLEYQAWELNPIGYHLVNVLLHAINAVLVWQVARRLQLPGAWMIGAVFALHPVHVESVAWITERKNLLSGLFYLSAMLAYLKFDDDWRSWRWYAVSLVLFAAALLSKTVTCSLPVALLLIMLYERRRITLGSIAPLLPMLALGLFLALQTARLEREQVGAVGPEFDFTFAKRIIIASRALLFYPAKIVAPWPLMFFYPRWKIDAQMLDAWWPVAAVVLAATPAAAACLVGRRGPALALGFFAITIFPALGFFNFYPMRFSFVADHFQYLASLGIIALVVGVLAKVVRTRIIRTVACAGILACLGALTWQRCWAFENEEILWRVTAMQNSEAFLAYNNLGKILLEKGEPDEAVQQLRHAVHLRPDLESIRANYAQALRAAGQFKESVEQYRILVSRPIPLTKDQVNLAQALDDAGLADEAERWYRFALERPDVDLDARVLLGAHLLRRGRPEEAIPHFSAFLKSRPRDAFVRTLLSEALKNSGRVEDALAMFEQALANAGNPADQLQLLDRISATSASLGRFDRAISAAEQALTIARQTNDAAMSHALELRLAEYRAKSSAAPPR